MKLSDRQLWDKLPPEVQATVARPAIRKRRSNEESMMQRALIKWWQANCRHFSVPELALMSIPNGGGRSGPIVGSILKAEGLRKGAPDLMLCAAKQRKGYFIGETLIQDNSIWYHALFIELKTPTGTMSPEQEAFHKILRNQGYRVEVVRSLRQGIDIVTTYLLP